MEGRGHYKDYVLDVLTTVVGCIVFAISMHVFLVPNHIAPGGVSGLAIIMNYLVPVLEVGAWSFAINVPLLLLGLKFLGKSFTIKTLATVFLISLLIDYGVKWIPIYTGELLLSSLFGGVLLGTGLGLVLLRGSSTGGTDIVSRLLQIRFPHISLGKLLLMIDVVIIALSAVVFGYIEVALYGMVTVYTSSRMINAILYGMDTGKVLYIISPKNEQIVECIIKDLDRGCTLLQGTGGFTGSDVKMLFVAVRSQQYYTLKRLVHEVDPTAFIVVTDSSEVLGNGFKKIEK